MAPGGDLADVTGRLKLKKRANLWRRLRWWIIGATTVAMVGTLVWLLWFSSVLVARAVIVEGTSLLTQDEVTAAAEVPLGTPLMRLNTVSIRQRVEALPAVASVKVSTKWPTTVSIAITERTAVYQRIDGSTYAWVDASGVIFHRSGEAKADLVPVTTGTTDARLLADVATVLASLSKDLRTHVTAASASTPDTIELTLDTKAKLIWGSADRSALKSQVATSLLQVKASVYDVSAPENPTTKG